MNLMKKRQKNTNLKVHKITMKKLKKQVKGITLIALVVTVIVLLILAGVAISLTVGNNGLFTRAENAANTWQEASEREAIELAVAGMQIGSMQETMTKQELENSLKEQFGDEASVEDNEDGSFLVTIGENQYYLGEDGEIIDSSNMLKISTANELKAFRDDVNNGNTYEGWYVYLTNDITLDINEEWDPIGLYPMDTTGPTDNEHNKPFIGIFDGKNHSIEGININTTNKGQGLFGIINGGSIYNVRIGSENNYTVGMISAALVGYLYNGNIYNCINESEINSTGSYTGGIAGFVDENSVVEQCSNYGNIISNGITVGGIVGQFMNSTISKCINTGTIKAGTNVGGITGYSSSSIIQECVNTGSISTNTSFFSGGISSSIRNTTINSCYNTGNINSATLWSGGITALVYEVSKIENCYNTGNVTGTQNISGICKAQAESSLEVINCYYLENTVNGANETNVIDGVTVKTSEALKALAPTLGTAFKEAPEGTNDGYPILQWQ